MIPYSNCQALVKLVPLWGILKWQVVSAVPRALHRNLPTWVARGLGAAGHKQQSPWKAPPKLLPSPSLYCLQHHRPTNQETSCWDKEEFIQKASRLERWWTQASKNHLWFKVLYSNSNACAFSGMVSIDCFLYDGDYFELNVYCSSCVATEVPAQLQGVKVKVLVASTLCEPMDCSPPGSSVHRILQPRILEWVSIPFSRWHSWPRDQIQVSYIAGRFFSIWATRETSNLAVS